MTDIVSQSSADTSCDAVEDADLDAEAGTGLTAGRAIQHDAVGEWLLSLAKSRPADIQRNDCRK